MAGAQGRSKGGVRRNQKARLLSSSFMGQMKPSSFSLRGCRGNGNWNCWQKNGSCDLPGFAEQANPAENLLWILVGFDVATMAYPEHQQFNSQEPL